ncbi:30794_t:CDS:2, partial [Racocetra persica]
NGNRCTGDLVIKKRRIQALNSNELQSNINLNHGYFLGCTSWKYGTTGHRYVLLTEAIDRYLLKNLINGMQLNQSEINNNCNTVLSNSSKRLICSFPYIDDNGNLIEVNLIYLSCDVTFYQLTPVDLIKCPYVALVSIGEHAHPPLPPSHISEAIKDRINKMINNASEYLNHITPRKIIL